MTFSDETMTISVTDSTKLTSAAMADGKMTESAISLSSLKIGDILMITLKEGTQEAETIRLSVQNN
jgi:hypothetical protein